MIFGKHINRYYLKYAPSLLLGLLTLVVVDYLQLIVPNLYQQVINGINTGFVTVDGVQMVFDMDFLLERICMPMVWVILAMVFGRFCGGSAFWARQFGWKTSCATGCLTTAGS